MPWAGIVCVEQGEAGRWGHSPTSIYLRLRGSLLHPVSISYSRCHSVCHILVYHTVTLWSGLPGWTNNKSKHSAGERGSHSLPKATIFLSYLRVQFSESYLGIILIPTQIFFPRPKTQVTFLDTWSGVVLEFEAALRGLVCYNTVCGIRSQQW